LSVLAATSSRPYFFYTVAWTSKTWTYSWTTGSNVQNGLELII